MLNISPGSVRTQLDTQRYRSLDIAKEHSGRRRLPVVLLFLIGLIVILLFLPWTQNIRAKGYVTTLYPGQRPQTVNSIIAGKIEAWHIREGQFVHKGDTLLRLSEIKDDYFDPELLQRTEKQIGSKEQSVGSYMDKIQALDRQIDALNQSRNLKLQQARNKLYQAGLKVKSDSIDFVAAQTNSKIAEDQYARMEQLYKEGLKSLTELEARSLKLQEARAKLLSAENKFITTQNEVINAQVEISAIETDFQDKLSKAESDKFTAFSSLYESEAAVTKMQNQLMNYSVRRGLYILTAPQDGYITKTLRSGIGETVKEGEEILTIMPSAYDLAVEMYVKPMDIPLIRTGQTVRVQFDGWPAVVFSGWPNVSYGTYAGRVAGIDKSISANGKYRILVAPDTNDHPWPKELQVGSGAYSMTLLKDVPVWYELWRQTNGFPPDYYETETPSGESKKGEKK